VKFIELGRQSAQWAAKTRDNATGALTVKLEPVTERYLKIYLPWRRVHYCINIDDEVPTQPCWSLFWHAHPTFKRVYFARWAWQ
jgi:hypothetical protein